MSQHEAEWKLTAVGRAYVYMTKQVHDTVGNIIGSIVGCGNPAEDCWCYLIEEGGLPFVGHAPQYVYIIAQLTSELLYHCC